MPGWSFQRSVQQLGRAWHDAALRISMKAAVQLKRDHLSQLLAEVRAYGLQNLVEGQAQMPPSHAAVADRLAAEVGRVVSEELEHFSDQKTWSEDPKYPQHP